MSFLRLFPGLKLSYNSSRRILFLSADFRWDARLFLRETDQKLKFWWNYWLWGSYLEIFPSEIFRPQAIIHDAAGAVKSHSGKSFGYCYIFGPGPNAVLLADVIGIFFCLPFSTLSTFDAVCLALYYTSSVQKKNNFRELGAFFHRTVQGKLIWSPRKVQIPQPSDLGSKKLARKCVEQWMFGLQ